MIKIQHLTKKYKQKIILNEVSLEAKPGECICIVGPNGSGKTTLISVLAGVLKPDCGEITIFGENVKKNPKAFAKYCGYVPQVGGVIEELSVLDNLKFFATNKETIQDTMTEFDLEPLIKKRVSKLSGGMKRRLAIACAVVNKPSILIMDEPTAALDMDYKNSVYSYLQAYQKRGGIVVIASHEAREIQMADVVYCLEMGECKKDGYEGEE